MKLFTHRCSEALQALYGPEEIRSLCRLLLKRLGGLSDTDVYGGKDITIPAECRCRLESALERLRQSEPIQYVLGEEDFYGRRFRMQAPVLIPRPETEELAAWILETCRPGGVSPSQPVHWLDVGTGSGCLAVTLALECPSARVEAWDVLPEALALARQNALELGARVCVRRQDLFRAADGFFRTDPGVETADGLGRETENGSEWTPGGPWNVIVSNPPYVCQSESAQMRQNVLGYESPLALFVPDDDPLRYYRALSRLGRHRLCSGGSLFVEINQRFGREVTELFLADGYGNVELRQDLFGRDRMVRAVNPQTL